MEKRYDCIVIGAGVSGMTAAIYLKRAGLDVLLLEKSAPGGQINQTSKIENYPGFLSVDGPTLAMNMFEQVQNLDISYQYGNVAKIRNREDLKEVITDQDTYLAKALIIATGRIPNKLNLEEENQFINRGVSWCALCDGSFYKNKVVGVIGSGNSALEEALYLSEICSKVIMMNRKDRYKGSAMLLEELKKKDNVEFIYHCVVQKLNEKDGHLGSITVKQDENIKEIKMEGLFEYIGYHPDTEILQDFNITSSDGYIIVDQNMKTNEKGIYACGDVIQKDVYQIATAIGEGAIAATQVQKDLSIQ
ncbi:MAG TPA: FAD-dependent oxidoreductase [Candidatus Fimihabitans intestinipullorum]|uniref:FAD-dependent oxidoreductase n=1 Tax=Candidatus Fimihabitans intestinipullorum TaxID=2840820 RepID=A0A9D1L3T3_9BACT|nr:FAD-dependent oxidoreductase [Candidatus Fimihabitans intestinipullorum]